jgi:hypothetical protein
MSEPRIVQGEGFSVRFDDAPGYLRAHLFDGTDSLEVSLAMCQLLADECMRLGATRLLVVEDLEATVTAAELELVVEAIFRSGLGALRVAFVELREDIEGGELGEIMCRERGMAARVFAHENDARQWLLYGD